jgi:hypothetical protein
MCGIASRTSFLIPIVRTHVSVMLCQIELPRDPKSAGDPAVFFAGQFYHSFDPASSKLFCTLSGRRNILVEPEQVVRVVASLDFSEPFPGRSGVGIADPSLAFISQEVYVRP